MESRSSQAVVLRWRAYGESDKIVTFLTRDFGKITGIGKGARNSRRRFPNSLELLARVRVHFRQRSEATLAFLESCELLGPSSSFMEPERLAYGAYLAELAEQMTVDWNPVPETYDLLEEALLSLESGPATASFLRAYELKLLERSGFAPPLHECSRCQGPLAVDGDPHFGPLQGVFWCRRCAAAARSTASDIGDFTVSSPLVARLRALREWPLERCRAEPFDAGREDAARLIGYLLSLHLIRPLKSLRLIEQLAHKQP